MRTQPADTARGGFAFPESYSEHKRQLDVDAVDNVADLFYQSFDGLNGTHAVHAGRLYLNFCSYDYLGLNGSAELSQAAYAAIARYGTSVSASRLVSGERPLHQALESELADWMGVEDALVFVSGYATNADTIGHLMGPDDLILYDQLAHTSIRQGIRLSGAQARPFPHGRLDLLERLLIRHSRGVRQVLIVVEGVYSMDGDLADLPRLIDLKRQYKALLMVDEAHSLGVLGETGRGLAEHYGVAPDAVDLWMGTLSKSLASCGGYIGGRRELITYLRHTAPGFVFSVGIAPPMAATALAALEQMRLQPERIARLRANAALFHQLAGELRLDIGQANRHSAIVPIMAGGPRRAAFLARDLMRQGVLALPIGYPAVPKNRTRLRFFLSASHSSEAIERGVRAVAASLAAYDGSDRRPEGL
ncbi:aminotransferase class I/II-fold pyridoxal phosphate-dependent enzyme [Devosia sp. CAU 1758]